MRVMHVLLRLRTVPVIGKLVHEFLSLYGLWIPNEVEIGESLYLEHRGMGTVIHPATKIGDRVAIYHQVTIGQADGWLDWRDSSMGRIIVSDDAIIFPGAKVLGGPGDLTIGEGTIIGANAVLTESTGDWEVWAGVPARKLGERDRSVPRRFV